MKIGERVLCIKNFNQNHYSFIKNKIYSIVFIHEADGVVLDTKGESSHELQAAAYRLVAVAPIKHNISEHFCFWFSNESVASEEDFRFDEYFVDIKKNRKDKILKINEKI